MKEVGSLPLSEPDDRDADIAGSVGEVVLDPRARQDQDADLHAVQHLTVALDGPCLGRFGPVRLEGDLRHLAVGGPIGRNAPGAHGQSAIQER